MTDKTYTVSGTIKWAKVFEPGDNFDKTGKEWSVDLYPDKESIATIKASGSAVSPKVGDDGVFYKFKRPVQKVTRSGMILNFEPPAVLDSEKKPINQLIGNGSKGKVVFSVYTPMKGTSRPGTRLEAVIVDELVEYHRDTEDSGPIKPMLPF